MSNKKKSSIDLFAIALYEKGFLKGNGDEINDLLEEHKAMHKEDVIDACNQEEFKDIDGYGIHETISKGEQYYNETFGGGEQSQ